MYLLWENLAAFGIATIFLGGAGWFWRNGAPFTLPKPLPGWFRAWFALVVIAGIALPAGIAIWGLWQHAWAIAAALGAYGVMLALQIATEVVAIRQQNCVWVLVPCIYLPYRLWQLLAARSASDARLWQAFVIGQVVLWTFNYGVHLSQLPRLLHWPGLPEPRTPAGESGVLVASAGDRDNSQ